MIAHCLVEDGSKRADHFAKIDKNNKLNLSKEAISLSDSENCIIIIIRRN